MTQATKALLQAFADAHRREATAREAAATATKEAREAAQLQMAHLGDLQASGITLNVALRLLDAVLGRSTGKNDRDRLAATFRKRRQRRRSKTMKASATTTASAAAKTPP